LLVRNVEGSTPSPYTTSSLLPPPRTLRIFLHSDLRLSQLLVILLICMHCQADVIYYNASSSCSNGNIKGVKINFNHTLGCSFLDNAIWEGGKAPSSNDQVTFPRRFHIFWRHPAQKYKIINILFNFTQRLLEHEIF
jgi:hypothetical protein